MRPANCGYRRPDGAAIHEPPASRWIPVVAPPQNRDMQIPVTVIEATGRDRDLLIIAPPGADSAQVLSRVRAEIPSLGDSLWLDCASRAHESHSAQHGLAAGAILRSSPARSRRPLGNGVLRLDIVGGPNAGLSVDVGGGRVVLGREKLCDVYLRDPTASRRPRLDHDLRRRRAGSRSGINARSADQRHEAGSLSAGADSVRLRSTGRVACARARGQSVGRTDPCQPGWIRTGQSTTSSGRQQATGGRRVSGQVGVHAPSYSVDRRAGTGDRRVCAGRRPAQPAIPRLRAARTCRDAGIVTRRTAARAAGHPEDHARADARVEATARVECDQQIEGEIAARRKTHPDPATLRERGDDDFLGLRLGLGSITSSVRIRRGSEEAPAATLVDVPATFDLRAGAVGIAGPMIGSSIGRSLIAQIAVLHSPADVGLAIIVPPAPPHRSGDGFGGCRTSEVLLVSAASQTRRRDKARWRRNSSAACRAAAPGNSHRRARAGTGHGQSWSSTGVAP